jgi:hypothetical protein
MEIIPNILTFLMTNTTVTGVFDHRITNKDVPDGQTYPYAYMWEVTSPQEHTHQGRGGRVALIQCDVVSDTITGVDLAKRTLFDALDSYKGMMGELNVGRCFVNTADVPKDPEQQSYRSILEIEIGTNN